MIEGPLTVGSFNIQNFGKKKMGDDGAVATIVDIIRRHDLMAVQEVSDKSGRSIRELHRRLNGSSSGSTGLQRDDHADEARIAFFVCHSRQ